MLAFHAIISAYGFWLPNDPRGSWSTYVGSRALHRFGGNATKVSTRSSIAHKPHDLAKRQSTKKQLKHKPIEFDGRQAISIVRGFQQVVDAAGYQIIALAVLPTHLHLVIYGHARKPAQIVGHLKRGATDRLIEDRCHPCLINRRITHSCWAKRAWAVYIDTESHLWRAIQYVQDNPARDGLRAQHWSIVRSCQKNLRLRSA